MEDFAQYSGAVWYIAPDKMIHHHPLESTEARWGFSDLPNKQAVTASPVSYQDATYGFRDINAVEDGSVIINDALIWGGSEWSGEGQTVFARRQNTTSQTDHNRWQIGEVHFGEEGFKLQKGVNARAEAIVNGGATPAGGFNPGLRYPQWDISLDWFAKDVPRIGGVPDHLIAGQLVTFELNTFTTAGSPLVQTLPLRRLSIVFAGQDGSGDSWIKFSGSFSLQLTDPYTLWRYLRQLGRKRGTRAFSSVDGSNPAPYGSLYSGPFTDEPNGSQTVFDLPDDRGYIGGTPEVYADPGVLLRRGVDYTESNPNLGQITFTTAPANGTWLWCVCRVTGA
jgi:hypothetical protein